MRWMTLVCLVALGCDGEDEEEDDGSRVKLGQGDDDDDDDGSDVFADVLRHFDIADVSDTDAAPIATFPGTGDDLVALGSPPIYYQESDALVFNGSGAYQSTANIGIEGDSNWTVMLVAAPAGASRAPFAFGRPDLVMGGPTLYTIGDGRAQVLVGPSDFAESAVGTVPLDGGRHLLTLVRQTPDLFPSFEIDGAGVSLTAVQTSGSTQAYQAGLLYVGTDVYNNYDSMWLYELAIWNRALSLAERQEAACEMHARWSLPLSFGC